MLTSAQPDRGKIPATGNWIELRLHGGKHANGTAYGARVTVMANEKSYEREVAGMRGWSNCDDQVIHIGLGEYVGKANVKVQWLGDRIQELGLLDINKRHDIYELK